MLMFPYLVLCFVVPIIVIAWAKKKSGHNSVYWWFLAFALQLIFIVIGGYIYFEAFGSDGQEFYEAYGWFLSLPALAAIIVIIILLRSPKGN